MDEFLTPPTPVSSVEKEQAVGMIRLAPEKRAELDQKVEHFVEAILGDSIQSDAFKTRVAGVHNLANDEIRAAASLSNRLLELPTRAMNSGLFDDSSTLSRSLVELRMRIESLDPSRRGDLMSPRKLLGLIPLGSKIQGYFQEYQSAQSHLDHIIQSLYAGQDELRKDNAAIEQEKANAWQIMERLEEFIHIGRRIDGRVGEKLQEIEQSDPEKGRIIREELLFYLRQKVQDLLTQLAVTVQGYLAMDLVRKNNLELIKGVDRATTTTLSALRTAVIVSQALANQKLVLDQIGALNATTSNLIESTALLMKKQVAGIHQQTTESTVDLDQLKTAFQNIYETMNSVSDYKTTALESMQKTVDTLSLEVKKSQSHLDRVRAETVEETRKNLSF